MSRIGISAYEARVILNLAKEHIKKVQVDDHQQVRQLSVNHGTFKDLIATGTGFYLRLIRTIPVDNKDVNQLNQQIVFQKRLHQVMLKQPHPAFPLQINVTEYTEPRDWGCLENDPFIQGIRLLYENDGPSATPSTKERNNNVKFIWDSLYAVEAIHGHPLNVLYAHGYKHTGPEEIKQDLNVFNPRPRSITTNQLTRDLYALTEALAHVHGLGFAHGDLKPNNIMRSKEGQIYLIDWDETTSLNYRGVLLGGHSSHFSPPELLFIGRKDTPGYLTNNHMVKAYPETIDIWQLAMTAYFMVTGHANIFQLTEEQQHEAVWQKHTCCKIRGHTSIRQMYQDGLLDFSHEYFMTEEGVLLQAWILDGLTLNPDERLTYSASKLLQHPLFTSNKIQLQQFKSFIAVNRDIATLVGDDDSLALAGRHGRLTRAAAVLYCGAKDHGYSKTIARKRAYPSYRRSLHSLSKKQKAAAITAVVIGVAAIVVVNVLTFGIPVTVAVCVAGAICIAGGVGAPLRKARKLLQQDKSNLRTAHRAHYVKFIDKKVRESQQEKPLIDGESKLEVKDDESIEKRSIDQRCVESKGEPLQEHRRSSSPVICQWHQRQPPQPQPYGVLPGMFAVCQDSSSSDDDYNQVQEPLLRHRHSTKW